MSRHGHKLIDMSMSPISIPNQYSRATEEERVFLLVDYDSISSDINLEELFRLVAIGCTTHQLTTSHDHVYTSVGKPKAAACVRSVDGIEAKSSILGAALPFEEARKTDLGKMFFEQGYWPYLYLDGGDGYFYDTTEIKAILDIFMPRYTTGIVVSNNPDLWEWINVWRVRKKKRMFCVIEPDQIDRNWQEQEFPMVNLTTMQLQWTQMFANCVPA